MTAIPMTAYLLWWLCGAVGSYGLFRYCMRAVEPTNKDAMVLAIACLLLWPLVLPAYLLLMLPRVLGRLCQRLSDWLDEPAKW